MIDIIEIQKWLMGSIVGIITLGAFGSIVGAVLLFFIKKIGQKVYTSRHILLLKAFFPVVRQVNIGRNTAHKYGPLNNEGKFLVYHVDSVALYVLDMIISLLSITITAHVAIAYGIERPTLLSVLIAINILTLFSALQTFFRVSSHVDPEIENGVTKIKSDEPKKINEWLNTKE